MQCPNTQCNNRALMILAEAETAVTFKPDGRTYTTVEYGAWYMNDDSEAYCPQCGWQGFYRDCKEADDCAPPTPADAHAQQDTAAWDAFATFMCNALTRKGA